MTYKPFETIYSMDFETTSLDPNEMVVRGKNGSPNIKARIWSIGIHESHFGNIEMSKEAVFYPNSVELGNVERDTLLKQDFYSNQSNDYSNYINNRKAAAIPFADDGKGTNQAAFLHNEFEGKRSGMILVQNLQFERKFANSLSGIGDTSLIKGMFEQATGAGTTKLFTPSAVTNAKSKLSNAKTIQEKDKAWDDVIKAYVDTDKAVKGSKTQKFYAADLMDFTKATWTKAAAQGYIPESMVGTGTGMELLAKILLGEEEIHGALSDARQQTHVFNRIMGIHGELSSGNISDETKTLFKNMSLLSGTLRETKAASSLISNIKKLQSGGLLDAREEAGSTRLFVHDTIAGVDNVIETSNYVDLNTDEARLARLNKMMSENYSGTLAMEEFSKLQEAHKYNVEDILKSMQNDDFKNSIEQIKNANLNIVKKFLESGNQESLEEAEKAALKANNIAESQAALSSESSNASYIARKYSDIRNSNRFLKDLLPESHRKGLLGAAVLVGGGLLYGMSDSADDDLKLKNIKAHQERLDMMQYNDPTFRQFSAMDYAAMPAGVGRANREAYNRSYEY